MSIQTALVALGADNGAYTYGLVSATDVVLVPTPPAWLLDPTREISAVVLPSNGEPVQPLTPRRLAVLSVDGADPVVAYLEVDETIARQPLQITKAAGLDDALEASGGDFWQALASIDVIPTDLASMRGSGTPPGVHGDGHRVDSLRRTEYESHREIVEKSCCSLGCGGCKQSLFTG